ncbi:MAG: AraC family transcriptional regulator [Nitrospira sp.]
MLRKKTTCVEDEYAKPHMNSLLPDVPDHRGQTKSKASGGGEERDVTGDLSEHKPCVKMLGHDPVAERLRTFLSARVSERVTLKELSRLLGYSEKYASDVFRRYMGCPFSTHLKQLRLNKATSMLLEERHTLTKIAESVGFSDAFAFSHFFKRAVGCSPTEYRRQQLHQADVA